MGYSKTPYFHAGRASDLIGTDRIIYRIFEILPGALSWFTLAGVFVLSVYLPIYAAYFIIAFDVYWLLKTIYLSAHLRRNWKRIKHNIAINWIDRLKNIKYDNIVHLIILPFYNEDQVIIENSIKSIINSKYDKKKFIVVLAAEERAGEKAKETIKNIKNKYSKHFGYFLTTIHPKDLPGEMPGKGSNISYAAEQAKLQILDKYGISYEDVIVSAFDIDTIVYPQYFLCLTWHFLTAENPYRASFQPVPMYNNNIWESPALSRVVATSGTFWQMIQQERPERLATFSSHSLSFKALNEIGYWQKNMVSEDSRIFWNAYAAFDGNYEVIPLSYPVSMDANLASNFFETAKNIYKQQRRWTWGVENIPYILFVFYKNKRISFMKKLKIGFVQIEGFWSLATNPILIFLLGWLPIIFGGKEFNETILSYNLPIITRDLMFLAMSGLFLSAYISFSFLPDPPDNKRRRKIFMAFQWILVPITMIVFGSIPGLDAQTRLMLGKYMGFWVTPKLKAKAKRE